jgi:hypothetical protein
MDCCELPVSLAFFDGWFGTRGNRVSRPFAGGDFLAVKVREVLDGEGHFSVKLV